MKSIDQISLEEAAQLGAAIGRQYAASRPRKSRLPSGALPPDTRRPRVRVSGGSASGSPLASERGSVDRGGLWSESSPSLPATLPAEDPARPGGPGLPAAVPSPDTYLIHEGKAFRGLKQASECISDHEDRVGRYGRCHERAEAMATHLLESIPTAPEIWRAEYLHRASNLRLCGHSLLFRHYTAACEVRLAAGRFCQQDKLCPLCALRRGGKYVHAYSDKIATVRAADPSLKPFMATITIANGEDVGERAGHLMESWKSLLTRRRLSAHRGDRSALAPVAGGVASIECIRGKGGGWHPHLHAVLLSSEDLGEGRWPELSREWHHITGDSMIVHVQPIADDGDLGGDLCEVFKYALKFADLDLADNLTAFHALKGRHLIRPFGNLRGVPEPDVLTDDLLSGDQPFVDLLYRFWAGRYHLTPDLRSDIVVGHEQETAPRS